MMDRMAETRRSRPDERADVARPFLLERIVFFSDAVFAIAITLLVVEIRVPSGSLTTHQFRQALVDRLPEILSFALSFWVIGRFWLSHHRMFQQIAAFDPVLIATNLGLLGMIAFLPFPTALLGREGEHPISAVIYASTMAVTAALSWFVFRHARRAGLVDPRADVVTVRTIAARSVTALVVFAASIPIAVFSPQAAIGVWLLGIPIVRAVLVRRAHRRAAR
jgi:uncharacterized membrane protein